MISLDDDVINEILDLHRAFRLEDWSLDNFASRSNSFRRIDVVKHAETIQECRGGRSLDQKETRIFLEQLQQARIPHHKLIPWSPAPTLVKDEKKQKE